MTTFSKWEHRIFLPSINELVILLLLDNESAGMGSVLITKAMQNDGG